MRTLNIDIETRSRKDLKKVGTYVYAADPEFAVLILSYNFDNEPGVEIDCLRQRPPQEFIDALPDPDVTKIAWNAQFERVCLSRMFYPPGVFLDPAQWQCTMIRAAMLGLPLSLDGAARVLKVSNQKMSSGMQHIRFFCIPNKQGTFNRPEDDPAAWLDFIDYCRGDRLAERAVGARLAWFRPPQTEIDLYALDQRINDRGIRMDLGFVNSAIEIINNYREKNLDRAFEITLLKNPNSVAQLKQWLAENLGEEVLSLNEKKRALLEARAGHPEIREMLKLRAELNKASLKKYPVMLDVAGSGDRFRGAHQFLGANRTWRWAGRLVQIHNLPKNTMKADDYDTARQLVASGNKLGLALLWPSVSDTLSQLIRTSFIPSEGKILCAADFSAIEARVIAWLAGEAWRLDAVRNKKDIYIESAARMFGLDPASIDKKSPLRQRGKVAELALGYQGGAGALKTMGALEMGIPEEDLDKIKDAWRAASPKIKQLWYDVQEAAIYCLQDGLQQSVKVGASTTGAKILFNKRNGCLVITLPSGHDLYYVRPRLRPGKYGKPEILYEGTKGGWMLQKTYGGKLVENIVQAIARDLLAHALLRLDEAAFDIVGHVHDEAILDLDDDSDLNENVKIIERIMSNGPGWAEGLPLAADCFVTPYYMKEA